jgi:hypothetical protein
MAARFRHNRSYTYETPTPASSLHPVNVWDCVTAEVFDVWWKW